jgi:hypothetical protein
LPSSINDPAAWAAWLDHLQKWGIVSPYTAPGMNVPVQQLAPPPANLNRRFFISPVSQQTPNTLADTLAQMASPPSVG